MVDGLDYGRIQGFSKPALFKSGAEKLCQAFEYTQCMEILNREENLKKGIFSYEVKVTLIHQHSGRIEAEGIGSCNSREKAYAVQDGLGSNTCLKVAKKRALTDAVLTATRSSFLFTQDIEDVSLKSSRFQKQKPASRKQLHLIFGLVHDLN